MTGGSLRCSVARGTGHRGAGLGNELIAWSKSFLSAQALGHRCARPMWGANRYGLPAMFGWRQAPLLAQQAVTALAASFTVSEALYRQTGIVDYGDAMTALAEAGCWPADTRVLVHEGMWGGYLAVRRARRFVAGQVMAAPGVAAHAAALERDREAVNVAVHVRRKDFAGPAPGRGEFNKPVPLTWYADAVTQLLEGLREVPVVVRVVSDAGEAALGPLLRLPQVQLTSSTPLNDLTTLMMADVVVPSVSSFSLAALWLGEADYLWYEPQLTEHAGRLSLWGTEAAQARPGSPTLHALSSPVATGRAFAYADGPVDPELLDAATRRVGRRAPVRDLVHYGVVRRPAATKTDEQPEQGGDE